MNTQHEESEVMKQAQPRQTNRLIDCTSPYLLQHAHNPVEWYPWGEEALEKARREDKPIFLSIGYAACHWCHVMEREVFEKPELAAIMNEHFVNIKVDREERPDLDDLYMLATQIMSGSGGWPMSVWLTPKLEPFYAGTYFPAEDGFGRPGFRRLELALAEAWKNKRGEMEAQARRVVEAIREHADETQNTKHETQNMKLETGKLNADVVAWARTGLEQCGDRFDEVHGGLGSAPKFPPHQALQFWLGVLEVAGGVGSSDGDGRGGGGGGSGFTQGQVALARNMVVRTLDGMMNGGIYDHVAGGFSRYSTDEKWLVPHFEKMLYDSAQLAPVYAIAGVVLHRPDYARVARETLDFFMREMQSGRGAFYSSLDADSEGEEGKYYVWTVEDFEAALGGGAMPVAADEDFRLMIEHFGVTAEGNWHEAPVKGGTVLTVARRAEVLAEERSVPVQDMRHRLDKLLLEMRKYREKRVRPGLDDKVLTGWNALMVSALAICGRVLREPKYLEAAHRLIGFLLTHHMEGGRRLMRVSRQGGAAHTDAFLDDHAYLLNGLMDLIDSTTPTSLPGTMSRKRALELADTMIREFADEERGGFYFTARPPRHEALFARMKNAADNATPSANGVAIRALLRLAQVSGKEQYREVAMRAVGAFEANIARRPEYFPTILLGLIEDAEATRRRAAGAIPVGNALALGTAGADALVSRIEGGRDKAESGLLELAVEKVPAVKVGAAIEVVARLKIAEGYHVQGARPTDKEAFRTVARLRSAGTADNVIASQEWEYPASEKVGGGGGGGGWEGYRGSVEFRGRCVVGNQVPAGAYVMRVTVMTQACTETTCLPPERVSAEFMLTVHG